MIEVATRTRRRAASLSACWRRDLAETDRQAPRAFLRNLKLQDREAELYWHPLRGHWVLYRCLRKGVVPSEDYLIKEWDIPKRDLGPWLLEQLREWDMTRNGSADPTRAARHWVKKTDAESKKVHEDKDKKHDDVIDQIMIQMDRYASRNRRTRELSH